MADFVQTMKDWRRMCQFMDKKYGNSSCDNCPLGGCSAVYEMCGKENFANMERDISAWAADHPEPVYPTWAQWLKKMGLIEIRWNGPVLASMRIGVDDTDYIPIVKKMLNPIPADIAEKLGIEPKEG